MLPLQGNLNPETIIALLEALPVAVLFITGEQVRLNPAAESLTGFTRDEITTLDDLFRKLHGKTYERYRQVYEADKAAGFPSSRNVVITRKDGSQRSLQLCAAGSELVFCVMHDVTDQILAPTEAQESAARYQAIKNTSMEGFVVLDEQGRILEVNDLYCSMSGYGRDELLNLSVQDLEAIESPSETREHIRQIIERGSGRFESQQRCKDGRIIDVEVSTTHIPDTNCFVSFVRDITDLKLKEEALRASEERFLLAMDATSVGLWDWTPASGSVYFSPGYYRMLGYEPEEFPMTLQRWLDLLHPEDSDKALAANLACTEGKIPAFQVEFRMRTKGGGWRWILGRGSAVARDAGGNVLRLIGTHVDITELKAAEEALRKSEWLLRECQRIAHIGTYDYNVTENRWTSSPELDLVFGIDKAFPRNSQGWLLLVHPDFRDTMERHLADALSRKKWFDMEYKIIRASDGIERWVYGTGEIIVAPDGGPARMIGTIQDITDKKETEEGLNRLNRELDQRVMERTAMLETAIREQEAFSYTVSHDLRAPLRHINSFCAILAEEYGEQLPREAYQYLLRIRKASVRMGELIDDLLELSRVGRVKLRHQQVDLSRKAVEIVAMLQETDPGRVVDWVIADDLSAWGDATLLRQLLENLLGNAWKYTARKLRARIEFGQNQVDGERAFFVKDNGAGFDMAYEDKLFRPFQRLHTDDQFEGTGIGLATVKRIIERHGGQVWAAGTVNEGATFYFTLPDN